MTKFMLISILLMGTLFSTSSFANCSCSAKGECICTAVIDTTNDACDVQNIERKGTTCLEAYNQLPVHGVFENITFFDTTWACRGIQKAEALKFSDSCSKYK